MRRKRVIAKGKLGRLGMLCLALVVALGSLGAAYGYWSGALRSGDMMARASPAGPFTWAVSNDDGTEDNVNPYGIIDPGDDGGGTGYDGWGTQSSDDPSAPQAMGVGCARYKGDVAQTTAQMSGDQRQITVLVENAYPCYYPTVFFGMWCGDSGPGTITTIHIDNPHPEALDVTTSGIDEGQEIPAGEGEEAVGAVHVHVEDAAEQNTTYTFTVSITIQGEDGVVAGPAAAGCPLTRYLTVDWEGNNTTKPLYRNDRLVVDLPGPSLDGKHSLLLERGTLAPFVNGKLHYLIVVRELEETPPLPENTVAIMAFNITPAGAVFDREIFLTLGLAQSQLPANALNITMAYYDDASGTWEKLEYEAGGPSGVAELTLSAAINHFSVFGVLAEIAPTPLPPAHFVASGLNIVPSVERIWEPVTFVTRTGESATVTANIANDGGQAGIYTVELKLNGEVVDSKVVMLGAGQSQQVKFTLSEMDYGQYQVEVAGVSDTFTVSRTITWWLIVGILVAIGLIGWAMVRGRRKRESEES